MESSGLCVARRGIVRAGVGNRDGAPNNLNNQLSFDSWIKVARPNIFISVEVCSSTLPRHETLRTGILFSVHPMWDRAIYKDMLVSSCDRVAPNTSGSVYVLEYDFTTSVRYMKWNNYLCCEIPILNHDFCAASPKPSPSLRCFTFLFSV